MAAADSAEEALAEAGEDSAAAAATAATAGSGDQVLEVASVDSTRHHRRPSSAAPSTAKCYSFNVHM